MSDENKCYFGVSNTEIQTILDERKERVTLQNSRELGENTTLLNDIIEGSKHLNPETNNIFKSYLEAIQKL
ncbi:MAG: hypothetical protein K8S56_00445 [Candidatus Cloacimonetes bacterium]|nr:hypothetical protein [Candidatus Cloacimonadota bacterium]